MQFPYQTQLCYDTHILFIFVALKKAIAIFFVAIYLCSATQVGELLKLPLLVEHYFEHKQHNQQLTLLSFLKWHYTEDNSQAADYEKDMKLPFKSFMNVNFTVFVYCPTSMPLKPVLTAHAEEPLPAFADYTITYNNAFLSAIWQPPRSC